MTKQEFVDKHLSAVLKAACPDVITVEYRLFPSVHGNAEEVHVGFPFGFHRCVVITRTENYLEIAARVICEVAKGGQP